MKEAGLINTSGRGYSIDVGQESKGRIQRYGLVNIFKTLLRIVKLLLTDQSSREFYKDGTSNLSRDILHYVGYGVYIGQKP